MVQLTVVQEPAEVYLTPTEQRTNERGVKVYENGRWVEIKDAKKITPGTLVSVEGIVYEVSKDRTEYVITIYRKHRLPDGRVLVELPNKKYVLITQNSQSLISETRFRELARTAQSIEVEFLVNQNIEQKNRELRSKPQTGTQQPPSQTPKPSESQQSQREPPRSQQPPAQAQTPKPPETQQQNRQQETRRDTGTSTTTQPKSSSKTTREVALLAATGARVISGLDFPEDRVAYGKTFREWIDAMNELTNGKFLREFLRATGLSEDELRTIQNYTLGEILQARDELFRVLSKRDVTQQDIDNLRSKYPEVLLTLLLRTITGDRELTVNNLNEMVRYVNSREYSIAREEIARVSGRAVDLLDQKNLIERYYFVKYAWPAIKGMEGMIYVSGNTAVEFRLNSKKGEETLETFLRERSANSYLLYKYGLPFLVKTTRSFDNLVAMLDAVEQVNRGIASATDGFGLNRLEQHRYYTYELPRIMASLYSNYAAAVESMLGTRIPALQNFQNRVYRYVSSPSGLRFDELMSVGELIRGFVESGQEFKIPSSSFAPRGDIRASPTLREPDIDLLTQGLILNTGQLATRYNRAAGYYFPVKNEWLDIYGELFYESTERSSAGAGRIELRGSRSRVTLELDNSTLSLIARDLDVLGNRTSGRVSISPERVSAELETQLDQVFRGANMGVVFERSGNDFRGILYAKIDGNWYRLGVVDRSWLMSMDVVIPGFANAIADVRIGDGKVVGVLGIAMPELSAYVNLDNQRLSAIASYLLDGNQLAAASLLTRDVKAPNLVYAGFYNGNAVAGGQYIGKDFAVSGMGVVGNGLGLEVTFANRNVVLSGSYANFANLSTVAAAARTRLGGYDGFAAFIASGERMFLGVGVANRDFMAQVYRMSRVDPSIFGMYSNFFRDANAFTGIYATFGGRGYAEVIIANLPEEIRFLFGGGVVINDNIELSGSVGIGRENVYAVRAVFPVGAYMAALGYMYLSNKTIFTVSLSNRNWLFGAAYRNDMLALKVRYGDGEREIEVYGTIGQSGTVGVAASYGFYLNEAIFVALTGAVEGSAWYFGVKGTARDTDKGLEAEIGIGEAENKKRLRLRAKAFYQF